MPGRVIAAPIRRRGDERVRRPRHFYHERGCGDGGSDSFFELLNLETRSLAAVAFFHWESPLRENAIRRTRQLS